MHNDAGNTSNDFRQVIGKLCLITGWKSWLDIEKATDARLKVLGSSSIAYT
jgi:hypothetical protein